MSEENIFSRFGSNQPTHMSRLAKKPITIPEGVSLELKEGNVRVKGPKGERVVPLLPHTKIAMEAGLAMVTGTDTHLQARANIGTMWSLVNGAVFGVKDGFVRKLEIEGVGYRAAVEGNTLVLSLGYVNPVRFNIPDGITVVVEKNTIVVSEIRSLKKPEPYKGKGIKYQGEVIIRKVGKKAAGTTTG